jgi:hypothetical protein
VGGGERETETEAERERQRGRERERERREVLLNRLNPYMYLGNISTLIIDISHIMERFSPEWASDLKIIKKNEVTSFDCSLTLNM